MLSITEIEKINQKLNPELALSLSLDNTKRMESSLLRSGFSPSTDIWKLILFYNGSLEEIKEAISFSFIPLLGNFAILFIKENDILSFLTFPQILYVELSRPIYENVLTGIDASCLPDYNIITGRNINATTLTGKGTAIAVLDSGADYRHPDFRNVDGSTRILAYWDQSLPFASFDVENTNNNDSNNDKSQNISTTDSQNRTIATDNKINTSSDTISNHNLVLDNPYNLGVIFSKEDLNRLLMTDTRFVSSDSSTFSVTSPDTKLTSPSEDISGHGTHIAGICAGNGRASNGNNQGVAPESSLIVVKLKNETASVYTDYANLMMAVDFAVRFANSRSIPLSINISYGSNDGSHTGSSLLELFMEQVSLYGKNVISVATGNEGLTRRHTSLSTLSNILSSEINSSSISFNQIFYKNQPPYHSQIFPQHQVPSQIYNSNNSNLNTISVQNTYDKSIAFTIAPGERNLYLEIWQAFADDFSYELFIPSGLESFTFPSAPGIYTYTIANTTIYLTINNPTPYQPFRQYFLSFSSNTTFITSGTWTLHITPMPTGKIVDGRLQFWLPSKESTNSATGFLSPSSDMTFTIPSTTSSVISVSGYDSNLDVFAPFSGQGFSNNMNTKPDLCAPAVNILSTAPGGGYTIRTGTSMAAPFVTGAAALLMQYGIINGNDPFLYGEKVKAYLWKSARPLPAFSEYPNEKVGWGALCLKNFFTYQ